MAVSITYFVHSTSKDNEVDISSGWTDPELSENGERQAIALGEIMRDQKYDAVFSSDLVRAHKTAHLAFGGRSTHIYADARLRECSYGIYNGKPSEIVEPLQNEHIHQPFPEGESYEDVQKRVGEFLHMLSLKYDGKHIAIVAHKAPQFALDVLLKGKTWEQAFAEDWRKTKNWQPGWDYEVR